MLNSAKRACAAGLLASASGVMAVAGAGASTAAPDGGSSGTVYVSGATDGTVTALSIDARGRLARIGAPVAASPEVRGVVLTPDGRFAYAAGFAGGPDGAGDIVPFAVRPSGELVRLGDPVPADGGPFGMAMAPNGRTFYATAPEQNLILAFRVGADGRPVPLGTLPSGGTNPRGVVVAPDGRHVYVVNGTRDVQIENTLAVFRVRANGSLQPTGRSAALGKGAFASQAAFTPDGRFVYVALQVGNQVLAFRTAGEQPTPIGSAPAPNATEGVAMAPDGRNLYTASVRGELNPDGASAVAAYRIGDDGQIAPIGQPNTEGFSPVGVAVTPDGRHVVAANSGREDIDTSDVSSFSRVPPTGALGTIPGSPFQVHPGGPGFQGINVAPNQGPVARFSAAPRPQDGRVIAFDARASADPDGRVARYDWDFGDGTTLADGGPAPQHRYPRTGTFTVRLTVTDDEGCADRQVFTGVAVLCNGTAAARSQLPVPVR
ncbi:beta-propeller fold lactonase family protein [Spirillospora sp. NPDC048911]|uniref:beta-propeller fold lactonase family protein n=1 Tax=Spirillospora sp. NPDC048911 TaxID=3364527 RepID=UPI0037179480